MGELRSEGTARWSGDGALDTFLSTLPGIVYRCDGRPGLPIEYVGGGVARVTGYTPADIQSGTWNFGKLVHPDDQHRVLEAVKSALEAHRPFKVEYRLVDAEGRVRRIWEEGRGVFGDDGTLVAVEGYAATAEPAREQTPRVLDARSAMRGVAALLRRLLPGDVTVDVVPGADDAAWVDAIELEQVFLGLVLHARDVPLGTRRVTISTGRLDPDDERVRRTGLGMARVDVRLGDPTGEAPNKTPRETSAPRRGAGRAEEILLVEDDARVRRVLAQLLESEGYRVIATSGAAEALAVAEQGGAIDLLLTDVVMPGMSGPEIAERIAAGRPGLKVLYVSGYTGKAFSASTLLPPTVAFLPKPVAPGKLFEKVRAMLDS